MSLIHHHVPFFSPERKNRCNPCHAYRELVKQSTSFVFMKLFRPFVVKIAEHEKLWLRTNSDSDMTAHICVMYYTHTCAQIKLYLYTLTKREKNGNHFIRLALLKSVCKGNTHSLCIFHINLFQNQFPMQKKHTHARVAHIRWV